MKPLLASKIKDTAAIKYPVYASAKLDGIRCIVSNGVALSRSLKPIPNQFVQEQLNDPAFEGLDGELIVGPPTAKDVYRVTNSAVMSHSGQPDFYYYVFDKWTIGSHPYQDRLRLLKSQHPRFARVHQYLIETEPDLLELEEYMLKQGYEGLIVRSIAGIYKHGRSTLKQGFLLKLKRFHDSEAEIIGFEELMHNANDAFTNELGHTARSSHQENQVPMGCLGALVVKDIYTGVEFKIGTGFSQGERVNIWQDSSRLHGQFVKYKYFAIGMKDKPRHPVFLGFRDKADMS